MDRTDTNFVASCEHQQAADLGRNYTAAGDVVFVVNNDWWFLSHRATWATALKAAGAQVTVIAQDTGQADVLRNMGFHFVDLHVGREASTTSTMAKSAWLILITLLKIRPSAVFLTAQAAYTLGWVAAIFLRRTNFIRVVSGVGRALTPAALNSKTSRVVLMSGRLAGRLRNVFTLFQVEHDRATFVRLGLLPAPERSLVIPGTGVDVTAWRGGADHEFTSPVILFASRLFREKGIYEFVAAAEQLQFKGWKFQVAGSPDLGVASAVTPDELDEWRQKGCVEILGHCSNMRDLLGNATLLVLPTRHPEGTPKILIEAGASGIPSVVSAQPGCLAVVEDGITGVVLSSEPDAEEVAAAISDLATDPFRAQAMGTAARRRIGELFALDAVLTRLLSWQAVGTTAK